MALRIVFMGTPGFAVPSLQTLAEAGYDIVGVITAPDRLGGRGMKELIESPVKKAAQALGLAILQPKNLKNQEFQEELRGLEADLQVVVAFRMLPEAVWNMPPLGTLNLHASLLPKYRGAAPIHWAVIHGETQTGLTTFLLKHEIDTGDILFQVKLDIGEHETTGELHDRMMNAGADLVLKTVRALEDGTATPIPQDPSGVTRAPKIHHADTKIDFHHPVKKVYDFIRGMSPYPGAWTELDGRELKVYRAEYFIGYHEKQPGSYYSNGKDLLRYYANDGYIDVKELKLSGKRKMDVKDFLNGYRPGENIRQA